jgi:hypothetical protein
MVSRQRFRALSPEVVGYFERELWRAPAICGGI